MKLFLGLAGALLCALPLLLMGGGSDRYLITGSSTVAPILQKAAAPLEALHPGLRLDVQTGGSTRGIRDAGEGVVAAGMASRDLLPQELAGLTAVPIAYDGVALIVHADNPVRNLTAEEVRRLFRKETPDWSEFGGSGKVTVVNKAEGRATLDVFLRAFELDNQEIQADVVVGDNAQGVRLVAGDKGAIGYVSIGEAIHARDNGKPIRLVALDGVEPSPESVADGSYPVRRTLYMLFPGELGEDDRNVVAFLAGSAGRSIIRGLHFVPVLAE